MTYNLKSRIGFRSTIFEPNHWFYKPKPSHFIVLFSKQMFSKITELAKTTLVFIKISLKVSQEGCFGKPFCSQGRVSECLQAPFFFLFAATCSFVENGLDRTSYLAEASAVTPPEMGLEEMWDFLKPVKKTKFPLNRPRGHYANFIHKCKPKSNLIFNDSNFHMFSLVNMTLNFRRSKNPPMSLRCERNDVVQKNTVHGL